MPYCDLTKNIILPSSQKRLYMILRIILIIFFVSTVCAFLYTLFFPSAHFSHDRSIDSLANTIKKPLLHDHITSFDTAVSGKHDHAKIVIYSEDDLSEKQILIRKSYAAFLSPIAMDTLPSQPTPHMISEQYYLADHDRLDPLISENAAKSYTTNNTIPEMIDLAETTPLTDEMRGFSSGSLLSSQSGIHVINGTKKHAIDDEITFLALGYQFDDVIDTDSEERNVHQKAKIYTIASTHPQNTFFATDDIENFFHYDGSMLRKVNKESVIHTPITVGFEDRNESVECILSASPFIAHRFICSVPLDAVAKNNGNIYRFDLAGTPQFSKITVTLSALPQRTTINSRITQMKKVLKEQLK